MTAGEILKAAGLPVPEEVKHYMTHQCTKPEGLEALAALATMAAGQKAQADRYEQDAHLLMCADAGEHTDVNGLCGGWPDGYDHAIRVIAKWVNDNREDTMPTPMAELALARYEQEHTP